MRVGIIGGGVGGLAAAYELAKDGHQVALYERAPFLGGLASTFEVGGGRLERFYHHLFLSDTTIIGLLQELGLGDRLIWEDSKVGYFTHGRIYPFATASDLLRFNPVPLVDRFRMGLVTLYLQKVKDWRKFEGVTAASWMRKWAGKKNWEEIWEPLFRGKFTIYAEQLGMPWLWSKFATRVSSRKGVLGREKLGYIRGSWQTLIDELERRLVQMGGEVHVSTSVARILTKDRLVTGLAIQEGSSVIERPFDLVIATVPSFTLPRLVDLPADYAALCTGVDYEGAIAAIWVLKRSLTPIYWLNVADRTIPFLLVLEQTNLVPSSGYGGKHVIYTANYVTRDDRRWNMKPEEIVADYIPHLKKINPAFDESWIEQTFVHKEPAAQPIMTTHYSRKIPPLKTPIEGLWTAAMSQVYPEDRGTNYSIRLGQQVARMAVAETGKERVAAE
ncbi:MAG: NAD(P)/FAD-dependent oxidoreductase [SAR202 cluster bacterium]|nr:NAD(P)/FAD-dependent oxidoreductase [SAR202 cluster bacterium]